jgi:hypothetical protein
MTTLDFGMAIEIFLRGSGIRIACGLSGTDLDSSMG